MPSLYELSRSMAEIDALLSENTDDETNEILESAREKLMVDIDSKMESILEYISRCRGMVDYYKSEESRIAAKRKSIEKRTEWLKGLVMSQMKSENLTKKEYGTYTCSICKNPPKIVLADEAEMFLPDDMCVISRVPNKTAIKAAMDGERFYMVEVDGRNVVLATLDESGESVRIK